MNKEFKKFDMKAPPIRQRQWLRPVTWALSFPFTTLQHTKIIKKNCEGLKPPYIVLIIQSVRSTAWKLSSSLRMVFADRLV